MEETGSGWRFFAATVLGIAGIMRFFDAIWAWRYHGAIPNNLEAAIFGHSLRPTAGVPRRRHHPDRQFLRRRRGLPIQPLDRNHRWRHPRHQFHLVDALLPDLVTDLHRHRCPRRLRPCRIRRTRRSRRHSPGLGVLTTGSLAGRPGPRFREHGPGWRPRACYQRAMMIGQRASFTGRSRRRGEAEAGRNAHQSGGQDIDHP